MKLAFVVLAGLALLAVAALVPVLRDLDGRRAFERERERSPHGGARFLRIEGVERVFLDPGATTVWIVRNRWLTWRRKMDIEHEVARQVPDGWVVRVVVSSDEVPERLRRRS